MSRQTKQGRAATYAARRESRLAIGLCVRCGEVPVRQGKATCIECRDVDGERQTYGNPAHRPRCGERIPDAMADQCLRCTQPRLRGGTLCKMHRETMRELARSRGDER